MKDFTSHNQDEVVPHSVEAEQQVLGAMLLKNDVYHRVSAFLRSDHFYDPVHADIYRHILARINSDRLASPVTLAADLAGHTSLAELGGGGYLVRMAGVAPLPSTVKDLAQIIVETSESRALLDSMASVSEDLRGGGSVAEAKSHLEVVTSGIEGDNGQPSSVSYLAASMDAIKQIHNSHESGSAGVSTGLKSLDRLIGGLVPQDLIVIAGATSMGKTALGAAIARHCADAGTGVGFASLEMSPAALAMRLNAADTKVDYQRMRTGRLSDDDFRNVIEGYKATDSRPIQIFDPRVRDIPAILAEAKRCKSQMKPSGNFKGFGLLVIDYFQIIRGRGKGRYEDLSEISTQAKAMAKLLDVPVVLLAQVGRGVSDRDDKRPRLIDLKDTGQLENDADSVLFCFREHYYLERDKPTQKTGETTEAYVGRLADYEGALSATKHVMEINLAKARMGAIGTVRVGVDMGTNRFWDLHENTQEGMEF